MRQNARDHFFRIAAFAKYLRTFERMVGGIGPALVIEVVKQPDDAPRLFMVAELVSRTLASRLRHSCNAGGD